MIPNVQSLFFNIFQAQLDAILAFKGYLKLQHSKSKLDTTDEKKDCKGELQTLRLRTRLVEHELHRISH